MLKRILFMIVFSLLVVGLIACGDDKGKDSDSKNTAAVVNDEVITVEKLDEQFELAKQMYTESGINVEEEGEEFATTLKQHVLDSLINEVLLTQASADYKVDESEVSAEFEAIKANYPTDEEFSKVLEENSLTEATLKERIHTQFKVNQFYDDNMEEITATDEEVQQLFDQYKDMGEEELNFDEVKPYLVDSIIQDKKDKEKAKIIEDLRNKAKIDIKI